MRRRLQVPVKMVALLGGAAMCMTAQAPPPPATQPEFEVASVKPNTSLGNGVSISTAPGGMLTATNVTLRTLIAFAFDIRDFQLTGGPKWIDTDRYDIVARPAHDDDSRAIAAGSVTRNDLTRARMKALLTDRFHLIVHNETREMPVYALVIAKNGPRLELANDDNPQRGISGQRGLFVCTHVSMKMLAERALAPRLGNIVLDKTGLTGEYNFKIQYVDDSPPKPGADPTAERFDTNDPSGPTLAVALQEQLGLKLETQKGPVQVIVVDSAEKASAN